jgi:hypothetical protein
LLFFETPPEYHFEIRLEAGGEEKLTDENKVRDFLKELLDRWIALNLLDGNALRIPFGETK